MPKNKIKVMYISPFYINGWSEYSSQMQDIVLIDWQLRLFNYISKKGHNILVKQHPSSKIKMPEYFFNNFDAKNIDGKFEKVYKMADIILTDYSGSTTFGFALKTKKPVIYIDFGFHKLFKNERELLKKRCCVIDGYFLGDNRAEIDWNDLGQGLDDCSRKNDRSYVNKVL
jgi:CDP-glycerol glycerophosphotransferase (TagB/SpsB family)